MEHDICLGEYHVPWVDQSLYSPHGVIDSMTYNIQVLFVKFYNVLFAISINNTNVIIHCNLR